MHLRIPVHASGHPLRLLLVSVICCLTLKILAACAVTGANPPATMDLTEADADVLWAQFLSWWPGDYDNSRQVAQSTDAEAANSHLQLHIRRVDLPEFGEHVFYAEWHHYEQPDDIVRQRFYVFSQYEQGLKLALHIFPNDTAFRARTAGAHREPSRLAGVSPDDMIPLAGCDVYFQPQAHAFHGAMIKQRCRFPAPDSGEPIYSWSQMRLHAEIFEYLDGWFRLDDTLYRQLATQWYVFEKRRPPPDR